MKIRTYQALPELLRNRFCKKCQGRILGRPPQAKYCTRCAQGDPASPKTGACKECGAPSGRGSYCRGCSSAAARKKRQRFRERMLRLAGHKCSYCQVPLTLATMTLDHYVPRALGGGDEESNLMVACFTCNVLKGDTHPDDLDPLFYVTKPEVVAV